MNVSVQIFGIVLVLGFVAFIVRLVRSRKLRAKYSFLWLGIGVVVLAISTVPGLLDQLSEFVGVYYPPALLFLVAIMLLMFLSVHFSWELSRLEDRTRTLAEELALANEAIGRLQEGQPDAIVVATGAELRELAGPRS